MSHQGATSLDEFFFLWISTFSLSTPEVHLSTCAQLLGYRPRDCDILHVFTAQSPLTAPSLSCTAVLKLQGQTDNAVLTNLTIRLSYMFSVEQNAQYMVQNIEKKKKRILLGVYGGQLRLLSAQPLMDPFLKLDTSFMSCKCNTKISKRVLGLRPASLAAVPSVNNCSVW